MFKLLIILVTVVLLFVYIMTESKTWQTEQISVERHGVEYITTKHSFHWERLIDYLRYSYFKAKRAIFPER